MIAPLPGLNLKTILEFAVNDNTFILHNQLHVQVAGIATGSPLGHNFANQLLPTLLCAL